MPQSFLIKCQDGSLQPYLKRGFEADICSCECREIIWVNNLGQNICRSMTCIFTWNVTLPQVLFKHFSSKNQLPGLSITETLVENGLNILRKLANVLVSVIFKNSRECNLTNESQIHNISENIFQGDTLRSLHWNW